MLPVPTANHAEAGPDSALVDWVEKGVAPGAITITSRDGSVAYPLCIYPQKTTWDGSGSPKLASSYSCR